MLVNGKEVSFLYTVGAFCEINDYVLAHPDVSAATANLYKAVAMHKAYCEAHGEKPWLTVNDLRALPLIEYAEIVKEMDAAEKEGSKRTVESTEKKRAEKVKG